MGHDVVHHTMYSRGFTMLPLIIQMITEGSFSITMMTENAIEITPAEPMAKIRKVFSRTELTSDNTIHYFRQIYAPKVCFIPGPQQSKRFSLELCSLESTSCSR